MERSVGLAGTGRLCVVSVKRVQIRRRNCYTQMLGGVVCDPAGRLRPASGRVLHLSSHQQKAVGKENVGGCCVEHRIPLHCRPEGSRLRRFGLNWPSVWVKMASSWCCVLLYLITLFKPRIIKGHDFSHIKYVDDAPQETFDGPSTSGV